MDYLPHNTNGEMSAPLIPTLLTNRTGQFIEQVSIIRHLDSYLTFGLPTNLGKRTTGDPLSR